MRMQFMCAQEDLGGTLPWGRYAVPVASPSQGGEPENHMSHHGKSFFPFYLTALTFTSNAATCSATKPLRNRNTHSSDSWGFSINQALREAMTYIVFNMEIEECLSFKKSLTHFQATNTGTPAWGRFLSTVNSMNANIISLSPRIYSNSINFPTPASKGQLCNTP